jgi:hypothetical protein
MNMNVYQNAMTQIEFDISFEAKTLMRLSDALQKRSQRKATLVRSGIALAGCAAAAAILAVSVRPAKAPEPTQVAAASPTTVATADTGQTPAATADSRMVVVSSEYGGDIADSYASPPEAGQALVAFDIQRALDTPANAGAYYFVQIDIFTPEQYANPLSEYVFGGRSVAEWRVLTELANGSYPFSEYNGDHGGNITEAQWQAAREEARTLDAQKNHDAAVEKYRKEIMPMLTAVKAEREDTELSRLQQRGCDVFFMDTWSYVSEAEKQYSRILAGVLSADQLKRVDEDSPCGFFIDWVHNGDGIVDWDENLRP